MLRRTSKSRVRRLTFADMGQTRLIAGAMSGTSADGVDVALTRVGGHGFEMTAELVLHHHRPYDAGLRAAIFAVRGSGRAELREIARIGREVSLTYAAAVTDALAAANLRASDLSAIAAHGQTLFHEVPLTIQYFDPSLVAYEVECPVVSDFRRADIAAGGQGAPLVPFADYVLFRDARKSRVLLNLGGIANITYLKAGGTPEDVIAFDTGPANCVIDHIARQAGNADGFDRGGVLSTQGHANFQVSFTAIRNWRDVFRPPPKSADTPEMIAGFEGAERSLKVNLSTADRMATACQMAALGIELALHHLPNKPDEIIASGGGIENPRLMREIAEQTRLPVRRADEIGAVPAAKEAVAFALLGAATLDGVASNVPSVTGARRGVVLGSVTPRP